MSNDVFFYIAFYSMMGIFVSLIIVSIDLNGPQLTFREVIKIIATGVFWPLFIIAGALSLAREVFKVVR